MGQKDNRERRIRIGQAVRAAREAAGLTQTEVARRLGFYAQNMCELESGSRGASLSRLEAIAELLGVPLGELV